MSLKAKIEAIIYAAEDPVTLDQIAAVLGDSALPPAPETSNESAETAAGESMAPTGEPAETASETPDETPAEAPLLEAAAVDEKAKAKKIKENIRTIIDELTAEYERGDRAMEIRQVAGGYRMATKPEHHDVIRAFAKSLKPPMKLSLQALETLAVIAYKQPVTAPEISEIRGVDCAGVLGGLISRKLITTAGRKQVIGRPILYKTTKDFLLRFGLKDLSELPSMEEFEKLAGENAELLFGDEAVPDATGVSDAPDSEAANGSNESQESPAAVSADENAASAGKEALEEHATESSRE